MNCFANARYAVKYLMCYHKKANSWTNNSFMDKKHIKELGTFPREGVFLKMLLGTSLKEGVFYFEDMH